MNPLIANFILTVAQVLTIAIVIRAILSWFPAMSHNALTAFLFQITEPILAPLRRIIPRPGMIDLSPLAAIIILQVISQIVVSLS